MVKGDTESDSFLCMQGVMFISGAWMPGQWEPGMYVVEMIMHGHVEETTTLPYSMLGVENGHRLTEYGEVESQKCPQVLCETTCPLKLSHFSLHSQDC